MAFAFLLPSVSANFAGGDGTSGSPYIITNWTSLSEVSLNSSKYFILNNSLSSSTVDYSGLGNLWTGIYGFTGNFNGNNKVISDAIINVVADQIGLFLSTSGSSNIIYNLSITNMTVSANNRVGLLVGLSRGYIYNVTTSGWIHGTGFYVGGLVGEQSSSGGIFDSSSSAIVHSNGNGVGGLAGGLNSVRIENCYATGNVTTSSASGMAGGLVGYQAANGIINNSYAIVMNITSVGPKVAGLVGYSEGGLINNSYSIVNGFIRGTTDIGALVGYMHTIPLIQNSYSIVNISSVISGTSNIGVIGRKYTSNIAAIYWIIRDIRFGNITFFDWTANVTSGNLIGNVSIINNSVYINSTADPEMNKSANISLSGGSTTFGYPLIYKDGTDICNSTTTIKCFNFTSLNANLVRFNVTQWSNYTIRDEITIPLVSFISPTPSNNSGLTYTSYNLSIGVSVTDIAFANATLNIYNSSLNLYNGTNFSSSFTYQFNPPRYGTYWFNVTTYDLANNVNYTETRQVTFYDYYFTKCNTSINIPVLNITFYDEITSAAVSSRIENLISNYYIFDINTNKTYNFQNLTANMNYSFCSYPPQYMTNGTISFTYGDTGYASRIYIGTMNYTNATTLLSLAMLPTNASSYYTFITYDTYSVVVPGVSVNVYKDVLGVQTLVTSGVTDSSGGVLFQLNPAVAYTLIYTKAGYNTYTQTVNPSQATYTIYLTSSSATTPGNGGGVGGGSYIPFANLTTKQYVLPAKTWFNSNEAMTFYMNATISGSVTASNYGGSRIELWANSTYMINSSMLNNTGVTTSLTLIGNCSNYKGITAKYYIYNNTDWTTYNLITVQQYMCGTNITPGNGSMIGGLTNIGDMISSDYKQAFSFNWWLFLIIFVGIALFCQFTSVELYNPMTTSIVYSIIITIVSIGGIFYIPGLGFEWMNKYSLAVICWMFSIGYMLHTWRERG